MAWRHESAGFDSFGLELPFVDPARLRVLTPPAPMRGAEFEEPPAGDPPALPQMLAIPGRFSDPARDSAIEKDGTRFDLFLNGRNRRDYARELLEKCPSLASTRAEAGADLKASDIAKAWFVIHDWGSTGNVTDDRFSIKAIRAKEKKTGHPVAVHGFVNRGGYYAARYDFEKSKSGTAYEFMSSQGRIVAGGKTINLETVPDIEDVRVQRGGTFAAASKPELYASIGHRKIIKDGKSWVRHYKWTKGAFETLADLYLLASARAGHLLTITAHKEMDRNLARSVIWRELAKDPEKMRSAKGTQWDRARNRPSSYHGDPYAFDMQALYDLITVKLNALGGLQMPPGARYGVHPLRIRTASGLDITNGSHHRHEFPFQSDPIIKKDTGLRKKGWWNVPSKRDAEAGEWEGERWDAAGFEAIHAFEGEDGFEAITGDNFDEADEADEAELENLAWIEPESVDRQYALYGENAVAFVAEDEEWLDESLSDDQFLIDNFELEDEFEEEGSGEEEADESTAPDGEEEFAEEVRSWGETLWLLSYAQSTGIRDRGKLADAVFNRRHPERKGRRIDRKEPAAEAMIAEWKEIVAQVVPSVLAYLLQRQTTSPGSRAQPATDPAPATGLGSLPLFTNGREIGRYAFTAADLEWLAKMIVWESGAGTTAEDRAVVQCVINRYAVAFHRTFKSFAAFLRAFSTTLQPVLANPGAARRHMNSPEFVKTGGVYEKDPSVPKGQLRRHLNVQSKTWLELPANARSVATDALTGKLVNPGIGNADNFASTRIYYIQKHKSNPTPEQWRAFTEQIGKSKGKWIGDVPGLDQMKNAFFLSTEAMKIPEGAIKVIL